MNSRRGMNMTSNQIPSEHKPSFRARGERHGNARLTAQQVREIRRDRAAHNTPFRELAERYSVAVGTIGRVLRRETWAEPEYEPEPTLQGLALSDPEVGVPEKFAPGHREPRDPEVVASAATQERGSDGT